MKPAHWIAVSAFAFVAGTVVVGLNRWSVGAVAPNPAGAAAADAERNLRQGQAAAEDKDYDLAISYFTEALRLRPGYREAFVGRFWANYSTKRWSDAVADADEVVRLATTDGERSQGHCVRGLASYYRKDSEAAIRDYSEALRLGDTRACVYEFRGQAYHLRSEWDKAIADYSVAIRIGGDDAVAYSGRARAYWGKRAWGRAIADFSRAIELKPDADSYAGRGACHLGQGEWAWAVNDGRVAMSFDENNALAHGVLADAYAGMGIQESAAFFRRRAAELRLQQGRQ